MDILGKLFSSGALVKIMRLFLLNPETPFEGNDIALRSKVSASGTRAELSLLHGIGFIKKKAFTKGLPTKKIKRNTKNHSKPIRKKVVGWALNKDFAHLYALKTLLLNQDAVNKQVITKRLSRTGKIKLIVLSGIFLREDASRIDMLIVGDKINKKSLESALKHVESEVGKELSYAAMDTKEFHYRLGMYDKFIRDILDYPHEKLVDKINI